jgi:hypothetical protein
MDALQEFKVRALHWATLFYSLNCSDEMRMNFRVNFRDRVAGTSWSPERGNPSALPEKHSCNLSLPHGTRFGASFQ